MAVSALDVIQDPLITPILALLRAGINADLAADMATQGVTPEPAIATVSPVPFVLGREGDGVLPALHCYRIRSRSKQTTLFYRDETATLQLVYVTPATGRDQIEQRWPILDRVWRSLVRTLRSGYLGGVDVLGAAGVIHVAAETANKQELYIERQESFPGFVATIDVVWRPADESDVGTVYPALSIDGQLFTDTDGVTTGTPDVISRVVLPAGDPPGRSFTRPTDWSL